MRGLHRRGATLILVAVIGAALAAPRPAAAASGDVVQTANTTYQLLPSKQLVQVSIDVRVENHTPNTVTPYTCIQYQWDYYFGWLPYDSTCYRTTQYYVNQTEVFVEDGASHLTAKANAGSVGIKTISDKNGYKLDRLTFGNIYNGQARTIHLTYQLPGGAPRSTGYVRAGAAYASFCATGNGPDGGSVNVVVPKEFTFFTSGGPATRSTSGSSATYRSGQLADPTNYYLCLDGTNAAALTHQAVTTADGRQLLIEAWPEDPTWQTTIASRATTSADALVALIGRSLPGSGPIVIQETPQAHLGNYVGDFDAGTDTIRVSEDLRQLDTVAHELAHTWFDRSLFSDTWLDEGYAEWAATSVGGGAIPACTDPGGSPGGAPADIANWQVAGPRATQAQIDAVQYQYSAACFVVSQIADAAGTANMRQAIQDMLDRKVPYEVGTAARLPAGPLTWRQWLDTVDEDAMVPAGADMNLAQTLIQRFGVDTNTAELAARSAARQQYHQFSTTAPGWAMPTFISQAMAAWRFTDATAGLQEAATVRDLAEQIDRALPGADTVTGAVETRFESAGSLADLQATQQFAEGLLAAAKAVSGADLAVSQATGPIETVGLAGHDLTTVQANAHHAIAAGDAAAATAGAAQVTQTVAAATEWGLIRLGIGAFLALVLVVVAAWLIRRRRRQTATSGTPDSDEAPALSAPVAVPTGETLTLFQEEDVAGGPVDTPTLPAAEPPPAAQAS